MPDTLGLRHCSLRGAGHGKREHRGALADAHGWFVWSQADPVITEQMSSSFGRVVEQQQDKQHRCDAHSACVREMVGAHKYWFCLTSAVASEASIEMNFWCSTPT